MGGSFQLLFIAISKTYRMYGLYNYILFLVQEAKELGNPRYIYYNKAFFHGLQDASNGFFIAITYGHEI